MSWSAISGLKKRGNDVNDLEALYNVLRNMIDAAQEKERLDAWHKREARVLSAHDVDWSDDMFVCGACEREWIRDDSGAIKCRGKLVAGRVCKNMICVHCQDRDVYSCADDEDDDYTAHDLGTA